MTRRRGQGTRERFLGDVVDYVLAAVDDFYGGGGGGAGGCRQLTITGGHGCGRSALLAAAASRLSEEAAAAGGDGEGRFRVIYFRQQPWHFPQAVRRRLAHPLRMRSRAGLQYLKWIATIASICSHGVRGMFCWLRAGGDSRRGGQESAAFGALPQSPPMLPPWQRSRSLLAGLALCARVLSSADR